MLLETYDSHEEHTHEWNVFVAVAFDTIDAEEIGDEVVTTRTLDNDGDVELGLLFSQPLFRGFCDVEVPPTIVIGCHHLKG